MRINNNITAMNTHRQYSINNSNIAKNTEKLSSGYRINRAGDDAAGLAISEKMRAQIRGLTMASKNSLDAISLVQTAEGALQETHNILQRMRELAVQSASDTNEQIIDRGALQQEFAQLQEEIDDIAGKTRFNDQNLIDGTFQLNSRRVDISHGGSVLYTKTSASVARAAADTYTVGISMIAAQASQTSQGTGASAAADTPLAITGKITKIEMQTTMGVATDVHNGNTYTLKIVGSQLDNMTFSLVDSNGQTVSTARNVNVAAWNNAHDTQDATRGVFFEGVGTFEFTVAAKTTFDDTNAITSYEGQEFTFTGGIAPVTTDAKVAMAALTIGGETVYVKKGDEIAHFGSTGITLRFVDGALTDDALTGASAAAQEAKFAAFTGIERGVSDEIKVDNYRGKELFIQSGANEGDNVGISINAMNTETLGIKYSSIATRDTASRALTEVNNAINQVSTQRAALGALQNRLEHKIANLDTSAENLQASESRIRDLDMAKEMTAFTKNNILAQAATAMLAQANSAPQGVLQLLR